MSSFWSRPAEPAAKPAAAAAPAPRASPAAAAAPAAASAVAPSGPQTTPVGPFKLKVVQLPNSALAYTNQIYISSRTPWMLQQKGDAPTYYILESKGVFLVSTHDAVNPGEVAMSGMQRDSFGLSQGFDVNCAFFNPAREHVHTMVAMTINIEYLKAQATEVKEEDISNFVKERLAGQIFKLEQMFPIDLGGKIFKCTVREIHAAPEKEDEKSTAHKRQNSEEFLLRTDLGQLQSSAMVYVTAVKNKYLQFIPSSKNVRRNLLRPDWKFSKMGIGGLDDEFATIFRRAFASRLFPQEIIEQLGIKHCKGILLFGPPGTGKTLIARQIGKLLESREPKVVNGPEILNRYVGASEEAIRALFKDAEDDYKANGENSDLHLIIFDEIDAICKARGSTRDGTGVHDTVVNQLLSKIDGVNALNNILVIGMTNRKDLLDEALLRPGRLEVHVEISLPDKKGRRQILEIHTQKMRDAGRIDPNLDLDELAEVTKNFSGAEIEGLVRDAVSHALYSHVDPNKLGSGAFNMEAVDDLIVTMAEFKLALEEIKPAFGVAQDELKAFTRDTLVSYSPMFEDLMRVSRSFVTQVRDNKNTQLLSVLLEGPIGCGKTAIAAQLALESEFPLVRLVTPDNYIGYSESSKVNLVNKVFEDAYKSPLSIVILDNIERLIEYSPIGPRFSNSILQSLLVLLKRSPPDDRRHLLIVATTSNIDVLQQLEVRQNFNFVLNVPSVRDASELKRVFAQRRVHIEPSEVEEIASAVKFPIPIKQLLTLIEMSTEDDEVTSRKFVENLQFMAAFE